MGYPEGRTSRMGELYWRGRDWGISEWGLRIGHPVVGCGGGGGLLSVGGGNAFKTLKNGCAGGNFSFIGKGNERTFENKGTGEIRGTGPWKGRRGGGGVGEKGVKEIPSERGAADR